jgi:putative hydrolase of the HAD superfamily
LVNRVNSGNMMYHTYPMFDEIALDADDTLWENESYYTGAKDRFVELISRYADRQVVEHRLSEIEIFNIRYYGYGIKSFVLSMIEAAIEISDDQVSAAEIHHLIELAKEVLSAKVKLFDHVEDTLARLSNEYTLMLITKGEQWEQERKINHSGLVKYFRYVEIVGDKNEAAYQALLAKYQIPAGRFLMVGNSLKSDILPVLKIGGRAVYIPYAHTWSHELEIGEGDDHLHYDELESIFQLPDFIRAL